MTDARHGDHGATAVGTTPEPAALLEALKTTLRLVPRQVNDEVGLAKAELKQKGKAVGSAAVFLGIALAFGALLVIGLVVTAIAGLGTVMPLWLSALLISALFLVILLISGGIGALKVKKLLPLIPEAAWRGIRYDWGIVREGRDFDPSSLEPENMTKEERKKLKAQKAEKAAKAKAERDARAAQNGPAPTETELKIRTNERRAHLLDLREELLAQANVKKQAAYLGDQAKTAAKDRMKTATLGNGERLVETTKERWKPLSAFAVSAGAFVVLLRKLIKD